MKLQVGERYRMRNGEIVDDLEKSGDGLYSFQSIKHGFTWTEKGKFYTGNFDEKFYQTDIIEHIPKGNTMNEKNSVEVSGITITIEGIRLTFDQIEKAYAEAQRIKEENEIKAGDFVITKTDRSIQCVKRCNSEMVWFRCGNSEAWLHKDSLIKINPDQTVREIYEGMK